MSAIINGTVDYCKTTAEDPKLFINTLGVVKALHVFSKHIPSSLVTEKLSGICVWASPMVEVFKPMTDAAEPLLALIKKDEQGTLGIVKLYREAKLIELVAKVSLVTGLLLSLPVYFSGVGAFSLGILTTNMGTLQILTIIDFARFTLINIGTLHNLYKNGKKWFTLSSEKIENTRIKLEMLNNDEAYDPTLSKPFQRWRAVTNLKIEEMEYRKVKYDFADATIKVFNYSILIFSTYISPVNKHIVVTGIKLVGATVSCIKSYYDAKRYQIDQERTSVVHRYNEKLPKGLNPITLQIATAA